MKIRDWFVIAVIVTHLVVFFHAFAEAYFGKFYPIYGMEETSTLPPEDN